MMRVGTKSLLFGAHQFLLHPLFVARAWWKLYGFPWDPRLWIAFFVHDLGYWGKPNMDGPEGEEHVWLGADLMTVLFSVEWGQLCLYHSRFWARKAGQPPSRLCYADKLATTLTPWWLYVPLVRLTGEIREYKGVQKHRDDMLSAHRDDDSFQADRQWFHELQSHMSNWVKENL